jgi:hypothetical protein
MLNETNACYLEELLSEDLDRDTARTVQIIAELEQLCVGLEVDNKTLSVKFSELREKVFNLSTAEKNVVGLKGRIIRIEKLLERMFPGELKKE